ncbi:MAG: MerR family DNA-binding transcriptional regulator [Acidimicrobiia bacterium]
MTQPATGSRPLPSQERRSPDQPAGPSTAPERIGWVTIREAHEQTGVPVSTLRYWAREGHVESQLDLTGNRPRRLVALDEVIGRVQQRSQAPPPALMPEPVASRPPSPPARTPLGTPRDQRVPEGAMIVPIDAWNKMLNQLGNLHEAGRQLAEARERAARAETEAQFLRERMAELRGELAEVKGAASPSEPAGAAPRSRWMGVYDRWWRRGR